jgi:hypothetical protein
MTQSLTKGQSISLDYHLTEYPDNASFDEILEMIEDDVNSVTIWCIFEEMEAITLISNISSLARDIDRAIENGKSNHG